jgi:hypothetical protein
MIIEEIIHITLKIQFNKILIIVKEDVIIVKNNITLIINLIKIQE